MSFNIGIDFGGVLSTHDNKDNAEHINTAIDVPTALENLQKLKNDGHKLHLISFCGKSRAIETLQSLKNSKINDKMSCADLFDTIYFVKDRSKKREMCEHLNCHFMIDDRTDILENIIGCQSKTKPILFGSKSSQYVSANNWEEVINIINSTKYFDATCTVDLPTKYVINI
jgi:hypothetical protein